MVSMLEADIGNEDVILQSYQYDEFLLKSNVSLGSGHPFWAILYKALKIGLAHQQ